MKELAQEHAAAFKVTLGARLGGGDCAEVYRVAAGPSSASKHNYFTLKVWRHYCAARADGDVERGPLLEAQQSHDDALRRATQLDLFDFIPPLVDSRPGATLIEYRSGTPLWKWAQTASVGAKSEVAERIVEFVARMDAVGFRHGDLHGDNVLVNARRVISVIDPYPARPESNMTGLKDIMRCLFTGERAP